MRQLQCVLAGKTAYLQRDGLILVLEVSYANVRLELSLVLCVCLQALRVYVAYDIVNRLVELVQEDQRVHL